MSCTDDSPSTDFERRVFSQDVPLSAFSSGTLIRLSTSSVESPGASVWISTSGGANSGKTSSGAFRAAWTPTMIRTTERARTRIRARSAVAMIQDTSLAPAELGAEQLHRAGGHDLGALGRSGGERREVADDALDPDSAAGVFVRAEHFIDPGPAVDVPEH